MSFKSNYQISQTFTIRNRCVLVRNSKYGVVAENNDELEYY